MLVRSLIYSSDDQAKIDLHTRKCILGEELRDENTSIRLRCMWDSIIHHHDIAEPMYKTWEHDGYGRDDGEMRRFFSGNDGLFVDGEHTLIANALITDEHSTVTGK